jgi:hypothetical protein
MGIPEGKTHTEDSVADGRIILKLILKNWCWMAWIRFMWLMIVASDDLFSTR